MQKKLLSSLTEAFAAQGFTGNELMARVFAAGYMGALLAGHEEAAQYFRHRHQEVAE